MVAFTYVTQLAIRLFLFSTVNFTVDGKTAITHSEKVGGDVHF